MRENSKNISLGDFVEGISLLTFELGRHPESTPLLTPDQEALLTLLHQRGKLSLKEIKTFLHIDTFQMSRLLSSVENYIENRRPASLVHREVNFQDKRQWIISLSRDGTRVLLEEWKRRKKRVETLLGPLTLREKKTFMDIINKMILSMRS
ncbi:MAG TPA: MarR family winged helix-turn-helix transcriptional regulator [Candidatus Hypogeohydataceae bacterium YC41]